jgi:hypothetical protein
MTHEITFDGKWVLINAQFYTFWMLRTDFDKYNITYPSNYVNNLNAIHKIHNTHNTSIMPPYYLRMMSIIFPPT